MFLYFYISESGVVVATAIQVFNTQPFSHWSVVKLNLPQPLGMLPESWLCDRSMYMRLAGISSNVSGMLPVSLFLSRLRPARSLSWAREGGIELVRLLKDRERPVRFLSWLRKGGMGPETLVQVMVRLWRLVSFVMPRGIESMRLGSLWKVRDVRWGRSPMASGMGPATSSAVMRLNLVMRFVRRSHLTMYLLTN
ncbi:hypothetical protein SASPL_113524 [Salvia splendens]|uniref:Uncharacterized protein n=1 Tax=Salvia splendens TaxID=180675 RepID=A0A8X8Y458_SALSN|nr:hypothetical protein SASPL_113524 [Salvia splendens]